MSWPFVIRTILMIFAIILFVTPGLGMSIEEAVSEALVKNPRILAAKKEWKAMEAKVQMVSTWDDPQLELMYERVPQSGGPLNDAEMKMYGLSQMIPFPGKLTVKKGAALYAARQAEQNFKAKTNQMVFDVKSAYYMLFLIDRSIEIVNENLALLEKIARIAEAKYVVGKALQHDVIKARIERAKLANDLITLKQQRGSAQARLNMLLDRKQDILIAVEEKLDIQDVSFKPGELEKMALENRPELKARKYALAKSKNNETLSKMQFLPDFKIKVMQREMRSMGLDGWDISLMAGLPLWFWSKTAGLKEASLNAESAAADIEEIENKILFEVKDALVKLDSGKRMAALYQKEIIPQAEQALRSATVGYEADKVDILTLISGQKMLEDAKLGYFKALAELGRDQAELERVIGVQIKEVKS